MADFIVVDTDILVDSGRGIALAFNFLDQLEQNFTLAISAVTQMELIVGCRNKAEVQKIERFLNRFHLLPINETISESAVELLRKYRLSNGLLIADALIASTAMIWEYPLASKNQRDYRFIEGLDLLPYP